MPADLTINFAETAKPLVIHFDAVSTVFSGANVVDQIYAQDELGQWYRIWAPDSDANPRITSEVSASTGSPYFILNPDDGIYYQLIIHVASGEFTIRLQAAGTGGTNNFSALFFNADSGSQYRVGVLGTGDSLRYQVSLV